MVERQSPLGPAFQPGSYGNMQAGEAGVTLSEVTPPSIVEAVAWPGGKNALAAAIGSITGLSLAATPNAGARSANVSAFSVGPERFLVTGGENLATQMEAAVSLDIGTVTDLSHGRTAIRIAGLRAEWVFAKLFAIDFSATSFPINEGVATAHHEIFAQIQRTDAEQFDIYVFRSFARAFWAILCDAAEEVGYEVRAG